MAINKRIVRQFKSNLVLYVSIFIIIVLGMGIVLGGVAGGDSIVQAIKNSYDVANVEDGHFSVAYPLTDDELEWIASNGYAIEDQMYADIYTDLDEVILRVFAARNQINLLVPDDGIVPSQPTDIFLEKHYAQNNGYIIGDTIELGKKTYTICGTGSVPDYNYILRNTTDLTSDTSVFSVAFLSQESFEDFLDTATDEFDIMSYTYGYTLSGSQNEIELKELINENTQAILTSFVAQEDNPRITEYELDCATVMKSSLVFAFFYVALIGYVIAIFASHTIEKEGQAIGALYAMGYNRTELLKSYLTLPVIVSFVSGVFSLIVGFTFFPRLITSDTVSLYSFPEFEIIYPGYLIALGILLPTVFTLIINFAVLSHKLNESPLSLLRNQKKYRTKKSVVLRNMNFITKFRLRYLMREKGRIATLFIGLFATTIILLLGFSMYGSVDNYVEQVIQDINFSYMYTLSGPVDEVPVQSESAFVQSMKYESSSHVYSITVMGIDANNRFFPYDTTDLAKDEILLSDAVAQKLSLITDDTIDLYSSLTNETYRFKIAEIVEYSNGLYVFTSSKNLLEQFDMDTDYYNVLISNEQIEFSDDQTVLATTTADFLIKSAQAMQDNMMLMVGTLIFAAIVVFIVVVYLIARLMIDKSAFSISLIKIFGYQPKEVSRVYLRSIFLSVLISILLSLPLGSLIIGLIYPYLVADYNAYIAPYISGPSYAVLFIFMMVTYCFVSLFLKRYLNKISFVEILKNRE